METSSRPGPLGAGVGVGAGAGAGVGAGAGAAGAGVVTGVGPVGDGSMLPHALIAMAATQMMVHRPHSVMRS